MLTIKTSLAAIVLAATAAASAGAGYLATRTSLRSDLSVGCPSTSAPPTFGRGVPLGGPPLPTNQGKKW